jgi:hypothetical protein
MLTKLLLWFAGADTDLLAKCSRLPQSERQRLIAIGGTVCIPATIAFAAWGYAAYTFVENWRFAVAFGALGAGIIVWLDRLLLLSFHKSSLESRLSFWGVAIARVLFSAVLSYGFAEPVTMLMFQGPIMQQIEDDAHMREEAAFEKADALRSQAYAGLEKERGDATRDLSAQLARKTDQWECMNALVSLEMAGGVAAGTPVKGRDGTVCGFVSGKEGCKAQCRVDIAARDQLDADIRNIRQTMQARMSSIDSSSVGAALDEGQRLRTNALAEKPSTDFATQKRALGEVEERNLVIRAAHRFVILLLVLLDSIALLFKALMPPGEYEEQRDVALAAVRAHARAERDATVDWVTTHGQALHHERLNYETSKKTMAATLQAVNELLQEHSHEFRQFQEQLRDLERIVAQIRTEEERRACEERVADFQRTFNQAWVKSLEKFRAEIDAA